MARLLNNLPAGGDLTFSQFDPNGQPFALRASATLSNILGMVEQERQRRRNQALIGQILSGGQPGTSPVISELHGQAQVPVAATARPQSALGKILSGVGGMFDPTGAPINPTDLEQALALQSIKQAGRTSTYQNLNKPPSDFQLWQQAQKEILAEAGGSAMAGIADPSERAKMREKTLQRFKELKAQFLGGLLPSLDGKSASPAASPSSAGPERKTLSAPKSTFGQTFNPFKTGDNIPFVLNPVTAAKSYMDKFKKQPKQQRYEEGTEAYNPKTGQKIKLINGKWAPIR